MPSGPPDTRASLIGRLPDAADAAAWDELVAVYGPLVYRVALRQGLQPADAEDLVQEVFVAVARSVQQWLDREQRGKFRAWLLRIARNVAINLLTRRQHRPIGRDGDEAARLLAEVPAAGGPLSAAFDLEYRREIFHWAAERVREVVSEQTWQAFWRTHMEQLPVGEVARQLQISTGSVYVGRSRVMARLRELVHQFEDVE